MKLDEKEYNIFLGIGKSLTRIADVMEYVAYGDSDDFNRKTINDRLHDMSYYLKEISEATQSFDEHFFRQPVHIKDVDK